MTRAPRLIDVDPFELPDWLGTADVTWDARSGLRTGHRVQGALSSSGEPELGCDLIAVDEAHPVAVADEDTRTRAHQAWRHGQVLLVDLDGRLALAVPGTVFTADLVLDALSRLARAVGGHPEQYTARLRIGAAGRGR